MSLHEDTLRNTRVFNSWFNDVDCVIVKIVINDALANSEIFISIFNDWFLEETMEFENLSIMLKPLGCNFRNGIVLLVHSFRNTIKSASHALSH
jgi:hypothetical protein